MVATTNLNPEDAYATKDMGFVETSSGIKFYLHDPVFRPDDIAHALAYSCRFNGHTSRYYSVAEHCLLVCAIVEFLGGNAEQQLEGLLHDATEAYLTDVPAPFKQFLPDWKKLDHDLDQKFRECMDLPSTKTGLVKEADWIALFIEAYHLLPDRGECFADPEGLRDKALQMRKDYDLSLHCMEPREAERLFLLQWAEYAPDDVDDCTVAL